MSIDLNYRNGCAARVPAPRRLFERFISESNPCYLLSAACMLLGLMTLSNSLSYNPLPRAHLAALIGTLNLYETVLIALALWLIARRKIVREAEILLAIEALFLADTAMLSMEMFTTVFFVGVIVNLVLLILTAGKLWMVASTLRLPIARTLWPLLSLQTLVLGLPGVCKWAAQAHDGRLPPYVLYGMWWTTALIPLLVLLTARAATVLMTDGKPQPWQRDRASIVPRRIAVTFAAMMGLSIVLHLSVASWIYKAAWYPADLAPLALGMAATLAIGARRSVSGTISATALRWQVILPALAVTVSLATPEELAIGSTFAITPLRCALIGAAVVQLIAFARLHLTRFAIFSMLNVITALLGATINAIVDRAAWPLRAASNSAEKLAPASSTGWGVLAVASAFALLAAGAALSVRKRPESEPETTDAFSVAVRHTDTA